MQSGVTNPTWPARMYCVGLELNISLSAMRNDRFNWTCIIHYTGVLYQKCIKTGAMAGLAANRVAEA